MSAGLPERLADLAAEARTNVMLPVDQLWRRGRRRQRRQQAVTGLLLLVVLVCLGSAIGIGGLLGRTSDPAGAPGAAQLPDRFFTPSPWLTGTAGHPIGPLIAVFGAERDTLRGLLADRSNGLVAVSARSGEYRFLDLPGSASRGTSGTDLDEPFTDQDLPISLSPDGRYIAYWLSGSTTRSGGVVHHGVVGYAVYDTVDGSVPITQRVTNPLGLAPVGFAWTPGRLWVQYAELEAVNDDGFSTHARVTPVVNLTSGSIANEDRPVTLDVAWTSSRGFVYPNDDALDYVSEPGSNVRIGSAPPEEGRELSAEDQGAYVSPDGRRVASFPAVVATSGPMPTGGPRYVVLAIGATPGGDALRFSLSAQHVRRLLGWRDDQHLLVLDDDERLVSIEIASGTRTKLSESKDAWEWAPGLSLAAGLLGVDVTSATAPARPLDPRLLLGLAAAGVATTALLVVRSARRRRGRA